MKPFLIGIAGPSGAGKSELARLMARRLPEPAALISLDSYYRPLTHLSFEERSRCNFDHPDALDWPLIHEHIHLLRKGCVIEEPIYLFDRHSRAAATRRVTPTPFVILEGLFALHDPDIREFLDARIFVTAPDEVCLARRLARDTIERGRTRESVLQQYAETVRPMAELFVLPSRHYADLLVSGIEPLENSWSLCRELVLQTA